MKNLYDKKEKNLINNKNIGNIILCAINQNFTSFD